VQLTNSIDTKKYLLLQKAPWKLLSLYKTMCIYIIYFQNTAVQFIINIEYVCYQNKPSSCFPSVINLET